MENNKINIDKSKLKLIGEKRTISDQKFDTKAISFGAEVFRRFKSDKIAFGGAMVVLLILVASILISLLSPMAISDTYGVRGMKYTLCLPKNVALSKIGILTGTYTKEVREYTYDALRALGAGIEDKDGSGEGITIDTVSEYGPLIKASSVYVGKTGEKMLTVRLDCYKEKGFYLQDIDDSAYNAIKQLEAETGYQIIYPMIDDWALEDANKRVDANVWYKTNRSNHPIIDENGKLTDMYLRDIETGEVLYYRQLQGTKRVRLLAYTFYMAQNNGKEPAAFLGTDEIGQDVLVRTMSGIWLSFLLGTVVFLINFSIGAIIGSARGFYGGKIDLVSTTLIQILAYLPFMVILLLVRDKLILTNLIAPFFGLVIAYISTGWIGNSNMFRTQFYRFKNQEYVLASKTLGASNSRLMFKHIFPNAIGFAITACAFDIPGIMISETTLSYLGIASASKGNILSLGTVVQNAQAFLSTFPHMIMPALLIFAALIFSFALFSNGLRDAFDPTQRGK